LLNKHNRSSLVIYLVKCLSWTIAGINSLLVLQNFTAARKAAPFSGLKRSGKIGEMCPFHLGQQSFTYVRNLLTCLLVAVCAHMFNIKLWGFMLKVAFVLHVEACFSLYRWKCWYCSQWNRDRDSTSAEWRDVSSDWRLHPESEAVHWTAFSKFIFNWRKTGHAAIPSSEPWAQVVVHVWNLRR